MILDNVPIFVMLIGTLIAGIDHFLTPEKIKKIDNQLVGWKEKDFISWLEKFVIKHFAFLFLIVLILTFIFQDTVFLKLSTFLNISKLVIIIIIVFYLIVSSIIQRHFIYGIYQSSRKTGGEINSGTQKLFLVIIIAGIFIIYIFPDVIINSIVSYFYFILTWYLLIKLVVLLSYLLTVVQKIIHILFLVLNKSQKGFVRASGFLIIIIGIILQFFV